MKVFVIGAGQVGTTVVDALHAEHELTVLDTEPSRLSAATHRYDVATFRGDGTSRRVLADAGIADADLVIACTSRDEVNVVAGMFARRSAPRALTIIRTSELEYVDLWREGVLDVDFVVCSELETAHTINRTIGVPAARQTDVFAEGQVQIVEFDVEDGASEQVTGVPLRLAPFPRDSKVLAIIGPEETILPGGGDVIRPGSRIVVIGSPQAAKEWSALLAPGGAAAVRDVVVYGAGRVGSAIARVLLEQDIKVRLVEASRERARAAAEQFPEARVYNATGFDPDFLERERIGQAQAAVFAMRDDAKNLYAASLAKVHGVAFTIAIAHEPVSLTAFDQAGIDVSVNPRAVTAEEIVRFAHDPRTQQVAMLEGNRYEVLDVTTRNSRYIGTKFRDMPVHGALIGAIVRDGRAIFPHGDDVLLAGDRVIVFTETANAPWVIEAL